MMRFTRPNYVTSASPGFPGEISRYAATSQYTLMVSLPFLRFMNIS
jgi:hypothetical protein